MAEKTSISWTDHTFNGWIGCQHYGPGCLHCYAEALVTKWRKVEWGANGPRIKTTEENWREPLKWNRQAEAEGRRHRVFTVVRQCKEADVACFVKQDSALKPGQQGRIPDDLWAVKEFPNPRGALAGA